MSLANVAATSWRILILRHLFILILIIFFSFACSRRNSDPVSVTDEQRLVKQYGSGTTFDIATWNLRQFPAQGRTSVSYVAQLIRDTDIDMFGLQEINSSSYFYSLLDSLPEYTGYLSELPADQLKLAIIYKKDMISASTPVQIFTNDWYAFPRPPLVTYVEVHKQDQIVFNFTLIVNHLKAMGDVTDIERRKDACNKLKNYIDTEIITSGDQDCILLGDLNDSIDDPVAQNVFTVFLEDSLNYKFLTGPIVNQASYIGSFNSLIDHLLITENTWQEYQGGETSVLYLEKEFSLYTNYISDHRPVLARFPVF